MTQPEREGATCQKGWSRYFLGLHRRQTPLDCHPDTDTGKGHSVQRSLGLSGSRARLASWESFGAVEQKSA